MTKEATRSIIKAIGLVSIAVGAFGSMMVMPFALTNSLALITTSGIYFAAGAVLIAGGSVTYALLIQNET